MFVQLEQRRRSRFPWVTLLLVIACVSIFVWLSLVPSVQRIQLVASWGLVPVRLMHSDWLSLELLRLVSALFVHADWLHLVGNLLFLVIFGVPTERALGRGLYLSLFLVGGALANLMGALSVSQASIAIVGCSGAVSAVMGGYLALYPRADLGVVLPLGFYFEFVRVPALLLIGLWVLLQLLFTWAGPSFGAVVWWTHIAGFVFGLLCALLIRPALARRQRRGY
ncbi:MAG: rhomboid family intramembrane serine protease [Rhodanobacteraceae bacterium]